MSQSFPTPILAVVPERSKSDVQNFFDAANRYLLAAALVGTLGLLAYVLYQLYWPVTPIRPTNSPFPVLNPVVRAGERLKLDIAYCKEGEYPSQTTRQLQGDLFITLPPLNSAAPTGCHRYTTSSTTIPVGTPPGTYKLVYVTTSQVNYFRSVPVKAETQPFRVIE